ncbi:MAG TPA: isochorismatase family cysteine hydrolase, partial [Puia sp.]|nr:isochorismatase family cysteine hydrolase [Puia sp.]
LGRMADAKAVIAGVAKAIAHARENGIPVIYVTVGFRKGAPEISTNNKTFAANKPRFENVSPEDFMKIHPDIAPVEGEIVAAKRRISAFTGSDLAVVLSAFDIRHLVLTGVATSGVVLSTLCEAADKDFGITVLADGCADPDNDTHRALTEKIFQRVADVITVEQWAHSHK